MPASKDRFVTGCQQLLALAAVLAVLTPAARVITLDVVHEAPAGSPGSGTAGGGTGGITIGRPGTAGSPRDLSAYAEEQAEESVVPAEPVEAEVTEHALTPPTSGEPQGRRRAGAVELVGRPQPVTGYGAIGVTWAPEEPVDDEAITFEARTETDGAWSGWTALEYHDEHAPDPDTREGRRARPGTTELLVGEVDRVQVRVRSEVGIPGDMRLAVVDPGEADDLEREAPELDTSALDAAQDRHDAPPAPGPSVVGEGGEQDVLQLAAASYTPKPVIYSRAQWGADESLRDKRSLQYFEVHAGFVHHTVNANEYTRAEVPGILRSIYAYHTRSRGWSDVGYNYLVDRFGRIWEGRYGGVDRPVVGAHTLGYNERSFAMSAIGNFDVKQPTSAMVQAYGALFAWKLSLHGVDASSPRQQVGSRALPAINGHRDAGQTACPGRYLYARLPMIRQLAAEAQLGWSGRELESDIAGTPHPDLLVRNKTDGRAYVLPTGGLTAFRAPRTAATGWTGVQAVVASPDLTGDGRADVVVQRATGASEVRAADGQGGFAASVGSGPATTGHDLLTAVGDLDGDGRNDLVARAVDSGRLDTYLGNGAGGFARKQAGTGWGGYDLLVGPGDVDGDGRADLLARDTTGRLWLHPGSAGPTAATRSAVAGSWKQYAAVTGGGDYNRDGIADLFVQRADNRKGYVVPGRGDGTFGRGVGPVGRTTSVTGVSAGGDLLGNAAPDLVARRGDDVVVIENAGTFDLSAPIPTGVSVAGADLVLNAGDWDRDGLGDMVVRNATSGTLLLRRGDGEGRFGKAAVLAKGFGGVSLLSAVGDMTGDGWPDLMGQPAGGSMQIYPGRGLEGLAPPYTAHSRISGTRQVPVGRWDTDGAPDVLVRHGDEVTLYPGNGPGGLTGAKALGTDLAAYDWVVGVSDVQLTGHSDVIARSRADGRLWLLPGTATGFGQRRFLGEGMGVYDLVG